MKKNVIRKYCKKLLKIELHKNLIRLDRADGDIPTYQILVIKNYKRDNELFSSHSVVFLQTLKLDGLTILRKISKITKA